MTLISGIDEAGRGPIIGPMVMAIVVIEENQEKELAKLGVKDSKLLTAAQREKIFNELVNRFEHRYKVKTPEEIDKALASEDLNLNWLEAQTSAELLNQINADKAFVDCPSNNPEAYEKYLKDLVKDDKMKLVVEHKADLKYLVCSAASIIAKVIRDREIESLKKKFKIDFGSGYPSDPLTKEFVEKNFDNKKFQGIFRESWETYKKLMDKKNQKSLDDF